LVHHRELIAVRGAFPHPHRTGHTDQTVRVPMEMRAVLPLLGFLNNDLVTYSILAAEPIAPILRHLGQRHLVRRAAAADQRAHQAEGHEPAEQTVGAETAHPRDIHRHDEPDHADD
jgi:hypothetical protein